MRAAALLCFMVVWLAASTRAGAAPLQLTEPALAPAKSETTALVAALLATTLPVAAGAGLVAGAFAADDDDRTVLLSTGLSLGVAGIAAGPSVGHFYAGEIGRGLWMAALRLGLLANGAALGFFGAGVYVLSFMANDSDSLMALGVGSLVAAGGAGVTALAFTVLGIVDAPRAVQRANDADGIRVGLAPWIERPAMGLARSGALVSIAF